MGSLLRQSALLVRSLAAQNPSTVAPSALALKTTLFQQQWSECVPDLNATSSSNSHGVTCSHEHGHGGAKLHAQGLPWIQPTSTASPLIWNGIMVSPQMSMVLQSLSASTPATLKLPILEQEQPTTSTQVTPGKLQYHACHGCTYINMCSNDKGQAAYVDNV